MNKKMVKAKQSTLSKKLPIKTGRPTKYKPEFYDLVLDLCRRGASRAQICTILEISKSTYYKWLDEKDSRYQKEFVDCIGRGEMIACAWWEAALQKAVAGGSVPAIMFVLKNRFPKLYKSDNALAVQIGVDEIAKNVNVTVNFTSEKSRFADEG